MAKLKGKKMMIFQGVKHYYLKWSAMKACVELPNQKLVFPPLILFSLTFVISPEFHQEISTQIETYLVITTNNTLHSFYLNGV